MDSAAASRKVPEKSLPVLAVDALSIRLNSSALRVRALSLLKSICRAPLRTNVISVPVPRLHENRALPAEETARNDEVQIEFRANPGTFVRRARAAGKKGKKFNGIRQESVGGDAARVILCGLNTGWSIIALSQAQRYYAYPWR
ncbi:hypothetical protein KM043_013646 [Ampulex compressa]|nr:hypothetical protein KM043_013646 [Ampulex compressa]